MTHSKEFDLGKIIREDIRLYFAPLRGAIDAIRKEYRRINNSAEVTSAVRQSKKPR